MERTRRDPENKPLVLTIDRIASPIGTLLAVSSGDSLCALDYAGYEDRMTRLLRVRFGAVELAESRNHPAVRRPIDAYFAGDIGALDAISVEAGGTPFQRRVWSALRSIPGGTTSTYGQLAARLGKPTASRAVGLANALNPIAIVVPCHRLIGANGALTGYAGGLERKRWLLEHEGVASFG